MSDVNANISVSIDTSAALAQLKELQRQISLFHTNVTRSTSAAALAQRDLQKSLIDDINATGKFAASLTRIKTSTESFTDSLERNKFSMREYFRYAAASTKTFGRMFGSEFDTVSRVAEERVKTLQTQYIKLGRDASGALQSIAVRPLTLNMSDYGTQTALTAQKQALFNQLMKQGSTNLLNFGKNTQWAGRQLMVGFTIPLTMLGSTASKVFMDMEAQAIKFKKVYGDLFTPQAETQQALDNVKELGRMFTRYGVSITDTMGIASEAAAAGFQGADLTRQTREATRLSVLGEIDRQQALKTTMALQNAFGLSSDQLAEKINFLNAVENQTVTSLDDITQAIPRVAPVIKQLGGDVEDLAYFLTAMKEGGVNAAEGANALKSGLASIINPTGKAADMFEKLNINVQEIVTKNKGNLKGTIQEFALALDDLDPLNRAQALEQLFGKFQLARVSALFANIAKQGSQASKVLGIAGTSIEDLAATADNELGLIEQSTSTKFKAAVENLKVSIAPVGEEFLKAVTPIVEFFGNIADKFNNLSDRSKRIITIIVGLVGAIGPVFLMTFGLLANGIANIIKLFMTLRGGFQRITGQSNILTEQTQYLTEAQAQAAAVAHSLDQTHANLIQTFNIEAGALENLARVYERADRAGMSFAARNPLSMSPGFPQPRKYAKGVVSVPGPKGAGDIVPAMLSPGESVIPAKQSQKYGSLIQGIVADNIPGYRKSNIAVGRSIERAHATLPFAPNSPQFISAIAEVPGLQELNSKFPEMIRVVSDLTAELPLSINQAFKEITKGGVKIPGGFDISSEQGLQRFQSEYNSLIGKFDASAKRGGADISDPMIQEKLLNFEDAVGKRSIEIAQGTKELKITDDIFAQATREVIDSFNLMDEKAQQVARALDNRAKTVGQVRVSGTQDFFRKQLQDPSSGFQERVSIGKSGKGKGKTVRRIVYVDQFGNEVQVARPKSKLTREGLSQFRPADNLDMPGNYTTGSNLVKVRSQSEQRVDDLINATEKRAGVKSPSRRTIPIGEDIARGLEVGMANRQDDVSRSGENLANAAISGTGRRGRRGVTTAGQNITPGSNVGLVATGAPAVVPVAAPLVVRESTREMLESQDAQRKNSEAITQSTKNYGQYNSKLAGASFALSSLSGVGMMFGGAIGELSQKIFGLSSALFALQTITQLVTKEKFTELIAARASKASSAMNAAATGGGLLAARGGIRGILPTIGRAVLGITRFIGPIGFATTAVLLAGFAFNKYRQSQEKARIALEAFSKATQNSKNELETYGSIFGVTTGSLLSETNNPTIVRQDKRSQIDQIRANKEFINNNKETIQSLKILSREEFVSAISAKGLELRARGFADAQIQAILTALKEESGRTDVVLNFDKIKFTKKALGGMQKSLSGLAKNLNKVIVPELLNAEQRQAQGPYQQTAGISRIAPIPASYTPSIINTENQAKLKAFSILVSQNINSIGTLLQQGVIDIKEYNSAWNSIESSLNSLNPKVKDLATNLMLQESLKKVNPQLADFVNNLGSVEQKTLMLQLVSFGLIDQTQAYATAIKTRNDAVKIYGENTLAATRAELALVAVQNKSKERLKETKTVLGELAKAFKAYNDDLNGTDKFNLTKYLKEQTAEITNQIKSLTRLAEANDRLKGNNKLGMDTILQIISNPQAAAVIANTTGSISKYVDQLNTLEQVSKELDMFKNAFKPQSEILKNQLELAKNLLDYEQFVYDLKFEKELQLDELQSSRNDYALNQISKQEKMIEDSYDKQFNALDELSKKQERFNQIQQGKFSLAQALSQGDMVGAANAIQNIRDQEAKAQLERRKEILEQRKKEDLAAIKINGKTREELENENDLITLRKQKIDLQKQEFAAQQTALNLTRSEINSTLEGLDLAKNAKVNVNSPTFLKNLMLAVKGDASALGSSVGDAGLAIDEYITKINELRSKLLLSITDVSKLAKNAQTAIEDRAKAEPSPYPQGLAGLDMAIANANAAAAAATAKKEAEQKAKESAVRSQFGQGSSGYGSGLAGLDRAIANANAAEARRKQEEAATIARLRSLGIPLNSGGLVMPYANGGLVKYFANGGYTRGKDTIPAMLSAGEYVVKKKAVDIIGVDGMNKINQGQLPVNSSNSVYNYNLSVNVSNSNASANDIARTVINQIRQIDGQRIRGNR